MSDPLAEFARRGAAAQQAPPRGDGLAYLRRHAATMTEQLLHTLATGPAGTWQVSTVRTLAGGARESAARFSFTDRDFAEETPWPFEIMVFRQVGITGRYHRPHASKDDAVADHERLVALIEAGEFIEGFGVTGTFGVPAITPEMWRERHHD